MGKTGREIVLLQQWSFPHRCCMAVVSLCREMLGYVPQRAQPSFLVAIIQLGTLERLPRITRRKVRTTSSHHGPYVLGYTRATMGVTKGRKSASWSQSPKASSVQIEVCNSTS